MGLYLFILINMSRPHLRMIRNKSYAISLSCNYHLKTRKLVFYSILISNVIVVDIDIETEKHGSPCLLIYISIYIRIYNDFYIVIIIIISKFEF